MWSLKQYNEAVFYLEACESGSMFENFPTNQKLYALTAANADESSWGFYCPPQDNVNGTHVGSCLGDLFSINWMEDSDAQDLTRESLQQQYQTVKTKTDKSHVMQYGDLSFLSEPVSNFIGSQKKSVSIESNAAGSTVSSRDAKLMYLVTRHSRLMSGETQDELNAEILSRRLYDDLFTEIQTIVGKPAKASTTDFDCYKDMIDSLEEVCGHTSDYGLKYFRHLYDICACEDCDHKQVKFTFYRKCVNTETA